MDGWKALVLQTGPANLHFLTQLPSTITRGYHTNNALFPFPSLAPALALSGGHHNNQSERGGG